MTNPPDPPTRALPAAEQFSDAGPEVKTAPAFATRATDSASKHDAASPAFSNLCADLMQRDIDALHPWVKALEQRMPVCRQECRTDSIIAPYLDIGQLTLQ